MKKVSLCALGAAAALALAGAAPAKAACQLGHGITHIIYLQFDNVHLRRDTPYVPSDLEQIPSLLNFLTWNGTLLTNHHTPLISHTSVDITTSLTGVYGEKFGFSVGNSFGFFDPTGTPHFQSSFAYWTDYVNEGTSTTPVLVPEFVDQRGKIHPAPWVPFTRAGCDVGAFSIANIEFENVTTDITNVFGANSPEATEAANNPTLAAADFEGIAIHCAQNSPLCAGSPHAGPDYLPDEPGGYTGFQALFGNKYVAPAINRGAGYVLDLDGNHITDDNGNDGFPTGFDPTPSQSLGYVAQMLEAGVQVVYFYIEDAHDNHNYPGAPIANYPDGAFGPGEANYVYQLKAYDAAFTKFFNRLAYDGISPRNSLFVITADENDHFTGPTFGALPPGCDGVTAPCTYPVGTKGEVDADLSRVFATEFGNTTNFKVHSDDAPSVHVQGDPAPTDPTLRLLEQQAGALLGYDPIVKGDAKVTQALADPAELALLHMVTHDPARTPSFVLFGNPDYFLSATGSTSPCTPAIDAASCFVQSRNFVWNHGDFQNDIVQTWLGIVGPGVFPLGETDELFTDHTDIRPTILSLVGLSDDYAHDGRVIFEIMNDAARPAPFSGGASQIASQLAEAYKAINAPTGPLGITTLTGVSTQALLANASTYATLESQIVSLTSQRNALASQMIAILEAAAFGGVAINQTNAQSLISQAQALLAQAQALQ